MFKNWYKRLREVRETRGYDPKDFAAKADIPYTVLNRYEKGRGAEVLSGRLKIKLRKVLTEEEIEYIETGTVESNDMTSSVNELRGTYGSKETVTLEYYPDTYASAGGGAYPYLEESAPMTFSKSFLTVHLGLSAFKDIFILNTTGESMEPTLKDGSLIFVNPIENEDDIVRDGGIYVMMCENTMLVKRIRVNPIDKTYTLISDHPTHDSITIAFFHESGCKFVGRVVGSFDRI